MKKLRLLHFQILEFVESYIHEHQRSPSLDEIGQHIHRAKSNVSDYIKTLAEHKYVQYEPGARTIRLLRSANGYPFKSNVFMIPLCGSITAGEPIPLPDGRSPDSYEEFIEIARTEIPRPNNVFALKVCGNSMIDIGVCDGDTIILENCQVARDGDSVAVRIMRDPTNPVTTLKEFHHAKNKIELRPRNPTMKSKQYKPHEIEIMGILIHVSSPRQNHFDD